MRSKVRKQRVRNKKTVYKIIINDEIWGVLTKNTLRFFMSENQIETELDSAKIKELKKEIERQAWNKLMNYLSYRERSLKECKTYLKRNFFKIEIEKVVIERASKHNFINNERYTELFVREQLNKNKSKLEVKNKLYAQNISENLIDRYLNKYYSYENERELIRKNLAKAIKKYRKFDFYKMKEKVFSYMYRKGFKPNKFRDLFEVLVNENKQTKEKFY